MKLNWQFGESDEKLEKEVDRIVGNVGVEELLSGLPAEIPYDDAQDGKLVVKKLGERVYQVAYQAYRGVGEKDFESMSVLFTTQPSLRLALFEMTQEIKKYKSPKMKKLTEGDEENLEN